MKKIAVFEDIITRAEKNHEEVSLKGENINSTLYWAYRRSKERNAQYLDFSEVVWEEEVPEITKQLREFGKKKFTISSTFSSVIKVIAAFEENGCKLKGITYIPDGRETVPAFLLTIGNPIN